MFFIPILSLFHSEFVQSFWVVAHALGRSLHLVVLAAKACCVLCARCRRIRLARSQAGAKYDTPWIDMRHSCYLVLFCCHKVLECRRSIL